MKVILDPKAGICGGVRRAIELAEKELVNGEAHPNVYVLGDIIHNEREVERLETAGLKTVYVDQLDQFSDGSQPPPQPGTKILIRAHGEPPETYRKLKEAGIDVVDGTCPVVTRSQTLAKEFCDEGYQVAIVGKHNHPEMIGIVGYTGNTAVIVQYDEDINALRQGIPTLVMAQTTISPEWFAEMEQKIRQWVGETVVRDTICRFVVKRDQKLPHFAKQADLILVVGGHKSSNTKMLHATCLSYNPRSYHVVTLSELQREWFDGVETIGVTGSASTPHWLLNEFVDTLNRWIASGWPRVAVETGTSN